MLKYDPSGDLFWERFLNDSHMGPDMPDDSDVSWMEAFSKWLLSDMKEFGPGGYDQRTPEELEAGRAMVSKLEQAIKEGQKDQAHVALLKTEALKYVAGMVIPKQPPREGVGEALVDIDQLGGS